MVSKNFDDTLLKILEKEVLKEKWKKKLRIKGMVINKKITKKGSFMFTIKTKKSEYDIVVPKHRKKEFELAGRIGEGDFIKAVGDKSINVVFCDRIMKITKPFEYREKQIKLKI